MAKKTSKKKVVISKKTAGQAKNTVSPTTSKTSRTAAASISREPMLFGKENYILIIVGIVLMAIGFILMLGGSMPDPNTWDDNIIYSFRRTVLAPFMILAGLVTLVFSIFKKKTA